MVGELAIIDFEQPVHTLINATTTKVKRQTDQFIIFVRHFVGVKQ